MKLTEIVLAGAFLFSPVFDSIIEVPKIYAQEPSDPKEDLDKGIKKAADAFAMLTFMEYEKEFNNAALRVKLSCEYKQWCEDKKTSDANLEERAEFFRQNPDFETRHTYELLVNAHQHYREIQQLYALAEQAGIETVPVKKLPVRARLYQYREEELGEHSPEHKARKKALLRKYERRDTFSEDMIAELRKEFQENRQGFARKLKQKIEFCLRVYSMYETRYNRMRKSILNPSNLAEQEKAIFQKLDTIYRKMQELNVYKDELAENKKKADALRNP